jgi:RNA chaperone Hfq
METNLLDRMLNAYQAAQTSVTVTLQNKIRVSGKIKAFDSYVIVMEGQKREILYRHAVSCLAPQAPDEQKRPAPSSRPAQAKPAAKPVKASTQRHRHNQPQAMFSASTGESGLNNSMKEGLLKWMQEQKAAK